MYTEAVIAPEPTSRRTGIPQTATRLEGVQSIAEAFRLVGASMHFDRDTEIYGQDEPAAYVYQVVSGAVRTHKLLSDGRRQIGAFHLPGDIFGFEAGPMHRFSAEAISDASVLVARRAVIVAMAARDGDLARDLWTITAEKLQRAEDHMLLLGRKNAEERVASFLLEMANRKPSDLVVELPMSRQDIADYLGLTIETVSRTLTQLESRAAIELSSSRRINLRNRSALQRLDA
jgi:CRP/FNR family transcriptional regulator, nitrogen fixation regulation protein